MKDVVERIPQDLKHLFEVQFPIQFPQFLSVTHWNQTCKMKLQLQKHTYTIFTV